MIVRTFLLVPCMVCAAAALCFAQTGETFVPDQGGSGRGQPGVEVPQPAAGSLTLQQALADGLMHSPELAAFAWDVRAAEARELQAGLLPNPEISADVENFAGNNELRGFDSFETTVQISQQFELGGKRGYRRRAAGLEKNLIGLEYEIKRLDVFEDIAASFWEVLAAQERVAIAEALFALAKESFSSVAKKFAAGKAPAAEEVQAGIAVTTAGLECSKARSDRESARSRLASAIGRAAPEFEKVQGPFTVVADVPGLETLNAALAESPDVRMWETEFEKRTTEVQLADAGAIPDITVSAGPRYYRETGDKALVMGLSVPIPLFHRNQGERQEARCNLSKAEDEKKAAIIQIRSELAQAHQRCSTAFALAVALRDQAIPGAQKAFHMTREGYWQGKFTYLMVLESQRTLFELKQQYVETLADYHAGRAAIERLIGRTL